MLEAQCGWHIEDASVTNLPRNGQVTNSGAQKKGGAVREGKTTVDDERTEVTTVWKTA